MVITGIRDLKEIFIKWFEEYKDYWNHIVRWSKRKHKVKEDNRYVKFLS